MIRIGVCGYGYWGPNIVRNFSAAEGALVTSVCDLDAGALKSAKKDFPHLCCFKDFAQMTSGPGIDAVAVVTPLSMHYKIAKSALRNGKHVFIEKPFTSTVKEAEELIALADKKRLKIMVDHTFLFTGAVRKIKEVIDKDMLGKLYYYDSTRVNLGLFQHDTNVLWDLAPHDMSILDYLVKEKPEAVSATGRDHFGRGLENIAYITAFFRSNLIAHFNINWLSPVKIRTTLIGGSKKMLAWNDLESDEKIKIYDKGIKIQNRKGLYKLLVDYRSGDMLAPRIDRAEALKYETQYFVKCVLNNEIPINDGRAGLRIVKMLTAADKAMKMKGKLVKL
ncbi:MAG: Gfo/Idh/MocA family oxidoreductase [Candidatus Omnitrophota bacterium]|nr:Gfo/Idh/MocA family oxidoreductase [Candidatus Omnitrophota bacterium]